jgi:hypothetical protein
MPVRKENVTWMNGGSLMSDERLSALLFLFFY